MADILIRNAEVPKGCGVCPLRNIDYCAQLKVQIPIRIAFSVKRRMYNCPISEFPEHGDLIERDAALSHPFANGHYDHKHADEHFIFGHESYKEWLEYLPVVIPSNKGESKI